MENSRPDFDAHIYFDDQSKASAEILRSRMLNAFWGKEVRISVLVGRPVGPHPTPMFEVNFRKDMLDEITLWLKLNRGEHSVLIHPVTSDELRDHSASAQWLGTPLKLDLSIF